MNDVKENKTEFKIVENGDSAFTIIFNQEPSEALTRKIILLIEALKQNDTASNAIVEYIPAYQSLTLCINPIKLSLAQCKQVIKDALQIPSNVSNYTAKLIEIPVCYSKLYAPDMDEFVEYTGLSKDQIIALHTAPEYLVHMLGFLPGFLYLGGLDVKLKRQRRSTPRVRIEAGSVGIGGNQTGIYPVDSPGGWHIIGRTPLNLFDSDSESPFIASPLDKVKFVAITPEEFFAIKEKAV